MGGILTAVALMLAGGAATAAPACGDGAARFRAQGATAVDTTTGLVWQRCAVGTIWSDGACRGERRGLDLDAAEALARSTGPGWRVPTVDELAGLLDESCGRPPVDRTAFPDITVGGDDDEEAQAFWTSSPVGMADLWWFVDFGRGFADGHSRGYSLAVRLVRRP